MQDARDYFCYLCIYSSGKAREMFTITCDALVVNQSVTSGQCLLITILVSRQRESTLKKDEAALQHTYRGAGGRGCIAPTHSQPRH
jgi:hypothetical protein